MAISSHTISNPSPNNWTFDQPFDHHHINISNNQTRDHRHVYSTITEGSNSSTNTTTILRNNNNNYLLPNQGRVSKPIRRRSRASRRTPTTVVNTDPSNFRAMVQQFTGGPASSSFSTVQPQFVVNKDSSSIDFTQQIRNINTMTSSGSHNLQYQYPNQVLNVQEHMMYSVNGGGGRVGQSEGSSGFGTIRGLPDHSRLSASNKYINDRMV